MIASHQMDKEHAKDSSCHEFTVDLEGSVELEPKVHTPGFFSRGTIPVAQPELIQEQLYPISHDLRTKIRRNRTVIQRAFEEKSPMLIVAGPSYVQSESQIKNCAKWLASLKTPILRANLSHVQDGATFEIRNGIPQCRELLIELANILPIAGSTADTITPQYFSDLYSLSTVSSTLSESQLHRELVSGVSYSVGFHVHDDGLPFNKDMCGHQVTSALDAVYASSQPHRFLSVTKLGTVAVVGTTGNEETFVILGINTLDAEQLQSLVDKIGQYKNLASVKIMIDLGKLYTRDLEHKMSVLDTLVAANPCVFGILVDTGDDYDEKTELMVNAEKLIKKYQRRENY